MKIITSFCLECQARKEVVKLPTRRYWAYCQDCLNQAFASAKNV